MSLLADRESRLLIDGKLVTGSGGTFETINPATEEVLGVAADADEADMSAAIGAARTAFDTTDWSTNTELRVRCLRQLREAMQDHVEELRDLTISEVGAPRMLTSGAQLEGPGLAVLGGLPGLGQAGAELGAAGLDLDEALEHLAGDAEGLAVAAEARLGAVDRLVVADDDAPVTGEVNVQLDGVRPTDQGCKECGHGVLREPSAGAPMCPNCRHDSMMPLRARPMNGGCADISWQLCPRSGNRVM